MAMEITPETGCMSIDHAIAIDLVYHKGVESLKHII